MVLVSCVYAWAQPWHRYGPIRRSAESTRAMTGKSGAHKNAHMNAQMSDDKPHERANPCHPRDGMHRQVVSHRSV